MTYSGSCYNVTSWLMPLTYPAGRHLVPECRLCKWLNAIIMSGVQTQKYTCAHMSNAFHILMYTKFSLTRIIKL